MGWDKLSPRITWPHLAASELIMQHIQLLKHWNPMKYDTSLLQKTQEKLSRVSMVRFFKPKSKTLVDLVFSLPQEAVCHGWWLPICTSKVVSRGKGTNCTVAVGCGSGVVTFFFSGGVSVFSASLVAWWGGSSLGLRYECKDIHTRSG